MYTSDTILRKYENYQSTSISIENNLTEHFSKFKNKSYNNDNTSNDI